VQRFGAGRFVAALDVRIEVDAVPRLATHGWLRDSSVTLWDQAERLAALGIGHVLCTDIGRDGALAGPNLPLYRECVRRFPALAWQASGGVRDTADLRALAGTGVAAAISGRALIEDRISPEEFAPFLPAA
jgi:phosphoribosylformimino-5-aminoimidazole carboxamide ribotide isomerase